jgi:hypothetical protein
MPQAGLPAGFGAACAAARFFSTNLTAKIDSS